MKETGGFDPYASWLGIPPPEQPPDYYRLLGIERFEQDATVIKTHAEQRLRQVNMYRRSAHAALCNKVLHQINTAKACLLNPMLKASYDRTLTSETVQAKPASAAPSPKPAQKPTPPAEETKDELDMVLDDEDLTSLFGAIEEPFEPEPFEEEPTPEPIAKPQSPEAPRATEEPAKTQKLRRAASISPSKAVEPTPTRTLGLPANPGYEVLGPHELLPSPTPSPAAAEENDPPDTDDAESPDMAPATTPPVAKRRRTRLIMAGAAACVLVLGSVLAWNVWGARSSSFQQPVTRAEMERLATKARPHPVDKPSQPVQASLLSDVHPPQPVAANLGSSPKSPAKAVEQTRSLPLADQPNRPLEIGIAYGTEKRKWLEWAVERFATTDEGWHVRVNLIPMGSLESAHAILDGDTRIHVWSPASSLYRDSFVRDWQAKHQGNPILKEEALALTPMAIVMWKSRYEAYTARCPEVSLRTFSYAMALETGWERIAKKPEWGPFKFGHTHPNQSNSGLMTMVAMAYDFHKKTTGLTVSDIVSPEFQEYLARFERGVSKMSNSTGNLMKEMVLKGPASVDALMVYESVVIDYLENAEGRWEGLQVIYPQANLWNENPYYILNTPWTTAEHQKAAESLLKFLMSSWIQGQALQHGFRPGNPAVPVKGPESPFVRYARNGLKVELPTVCEVPSPDVIENLLQSWIRNAPSR